MTLHTLMMLLPLSCLLAVFVCCPVSLYEYYWLLVRFQWFRCFSSHLQGAFSLSCLLAVFVCCPVSLYEYYWLLVRFQWFRCFSSHLQGAFSLSCLLPGITVRILLVARSFSLFMMLLSLSCLFAVFPFCSPVSLYEYYWLLACGSKCQRA